MLPKPPKVSDGNWASRSLRSCLTGGILPQRQRAEQRGRGQRSCGRLRAQRRTELPLLPGSLGDASTPAKSRPCFCFPCRRSVPTTARPARPAPLQQEAAHNRRRCRMPARAALPAAGTGPAAGTPIPRGGRPLLRGQEPPRLPAPLQLLQSLLGPPYRTLAEKQYCSYLRHQHRSLISNVPFLKPNHLSVYQTAPVTQQRPPTVPPQRKHGASRENLL